jgi:arginine decarboxylase
MSEEGDGRANRINRFFAGPGARGDQWRNLVELAEGWVNGSGSRPEFEAAVAETMATEEFHAFPGPQLMTASRDHAATNDAHATATLAKG